MQTEIIKKEKMVIHVKPYGNKELANIYGISTRTLRNWIAPLKAEVGERRGHYYNVRQVEKIFDELGLPSILEVGFKISNN